MTETLQLVCASLHRIFDCGPYFFFGTICLVMSRSNVWLQNICVEGEYGPALMVSDFCSIVMKQLNRKVVYIQKISSWISSQSWIGREYTVPWIKLIVILQQRIENQTLSS